MARPNAVAENNAIANTPASAVTVIGARARRSTIDSELRSVAALRPRATRERSGPLPSIEVADALLDERLRADRVGHNPPRQ